MSLSGDIVRVSSYNTPDSFLNEPTRLSGLSVQKLSYFFKVRTDADFEKIVDNGRIRV